MIGRASANTVRLADRTVSRYHARISSDPERATIQDAGSSFGTWVDGRRLDAPAPLRDGATVAVGDVELLVERPPELHEAGRTVVVPEGLTSRLSAAEAGPRLRSGHALKRLEAGEGERRWV